MGIFSRKESRDKCKVCGKSLPSNGDATCSKCGTMDTDRFHAKQGRPLTPVTPQPISEQDEDEDEDDLNEMMRKINERLKTKKPNNDDGLEPVHPVEDSEQNEEEEDSDEEEQSDEERYDDDPLYCDDCSSALDFDTEVDVVNGEFKGKYHTDEYAMVCEHCSVRRCSDCDEPLDSEGYCKDCDRCSECSKILNHEGNCPDGH